MGLIQTAMMSGTAMYGLNKLSKGYETHQRSRPAQQQQHMQPQYQSREYSPNSPQRNNGGDYYDNRNHSPQPFDPSQQQSSFGTSATAYPQEYWYLNNNNEWARLPSEYANIRSGGLGFERQTAPLPQYPARQQQDCFDYPQRQQGYVVEEVMDPRSQPPVSSHQVQQGLGLLMNAGAKAPKKEKDHSKLFNVLSMFSN
jgi:hypothetical protein